MTKEQLAELRATGADLIKQERERQISKEGWTPAHDDTHNFAELTRASISYALLASKQACYGYVSQWVPVFWPFDSVWWKPSDDPIRNLIKAGALIAAEIDRLQRMKDASEVSRG